MNITVNERYNSIAEFQKALERREIGYMYDRKNTNVDFRGTRTHEEADKLLINGDTFTAKIIRSCNTQKKNNRTTNTIKQDFCGFVPNVGAVVSGSPINMYNIKQTTYKSTKVLNLVYFVGASCATDKTELAEAGAKLLNVINTIEARGYKVNLFVATCLIPQINGRKRADSRLNLAIKIKDSGKHLNITKIAYPIAHPSFFRRHVCLWVNTICKDATNSYTVTDTKELTAAANRICKGAKFVSFYTLSEKSEEDILKRVLS